jgi:hypothetical protein
MKILRESDDELTIFCSSLGEKLTILIFLAVYSPVSFGLGTIVVANAELPARWDQVSNFLGALVFFSGFLLVFGVLPPALLLFGLVKARDTVFEFRGGERQLIVRHRRREQNIPFDEIIRAEVFNRNTFSDGGNAYELRLVLRGGDPLSISKISNSWSREKLALAERINQFVDAHRGREESEGGD